MGDKKLAKITTVTTAAEETLTHYLTVGDSAVALFIAASFLEVRLETVMKYFFQSKKLHAEGLYTDLKLSPMIRLAHDLNVITKTEHDEFLALVKRRNILGHETEGWREWGTEDDRLNRRLTNQVLDFIKANETKSKIGKRLASMPRVAPPRSAKGSRP